MSVEKEKPKKPRGIIHKVVSPQIGQTTEPEPEGEGKDDDEDMFGE